MVAGAAVRVAICHSYRAWPRMSRPAIVLLMLMAAATDFAGPAAATERVPVGAEKPRMAIVFSRDCRSTSDEPKHARQNACAAAFAGFVNWPTADCPLATRDATCAEAAPAQHAGEDVSNGPGGFGPTSKFECQNNYAWAVRNDQTAAFPPLKFLPSARGKFLVELDCGGGAYNTRNAYLFYDETVMPPVLKRSAFPITTFSQAETMIRRPPSRKRSG